MRAGKLWPLSVVDTADGACAGLGLDPSTDAGLVISMLTSRIVGDGNPVSNLETHRTEDAARLFFQDSQCTLKYPSVYKVPYGFKTIILCILVQNATVVRKGEVAEATRIWKQFCSFGGRLFWLGF